MSITEQKSKTLCYNCAYPEDGLTSVDWCDGQVCQYCFDEKFVPYNKKYPMTDLCWTCDENTATHKEYREALDEMELTCDSCHREEYPEKYKEIRECFKCEKNYMGFDSDCCCGSCCWYCKDNGGEDTYKKRKKEEAYEAMWSKRN